MAVKKSKMGGRKRAGTRTTRSVEAKAGKRTPSKRAGKSAPSRSDTRTRKRAKSPATRARAASPALARAVRVELTSFNTHGAVDRSGKVEPKVASHLRGARPLVACFQELFFRDELERLDRELLGPVTNRLPGSTDQLEIRGSTGGTFARRVAATRTGLVGGATAGLAIYTSLPFRAARFRSFDGAQIPDVFAVKGVLAIDITFEGFTFVMANTHFHDSDNDDVDGRARRACIRTLGAVLAESAGLPALIVGDFNIDTSAREGLDPGLFARLAAVGGGQFIEAGRENARENGLARPVPTTSSGRKSIDFVLASGAGRGVTLVPGSYRARDDFGSDHRLVRATLEFR